MSWRSEIKNYIKKLKFDFEKNGIKLLNQLPNISEIKSDRYYEKWVSTIFVDIVGYTDFCDEYSAQDIIKQTSTFHKGIISIMEHFNVKHINVQGDGIFCFIEHDGTFEKLTDVIKISIEINSYLSYVWKIDNDLDYKISTFTTLELMFKIGDFENGSVIYVGGGVNRSKHLMKINKNKNFILFDGITILFLKGTNNEFILENLNLIEKTYFDSIGDEIVYFECDVLNEKWKNI